MSHSDELIMGFIGETLEIKVCRENFDESLAIHQICQSFPLSNFCAIRYIAILYVFVNKFDKILLP